MELNFNILIKFQKDKALFYAKLINQNIFKYQTVFPARLDEQDEYGQMLHEIEICIDLNNNQNLTESDNGKTDI